MKDPNRPNEGETLSAHAIRALDQKAIAELGIPGLILMENAGQKAADLCRQIMSESSLEICLLFAGCGNNAGDAFVVARHLAIHGIKAQIILVRRDDEFAPDSDAGRHLELARKCGVAVVRAATSEFSEIISLAGKATLLVDGLLGTGVKGAPRSPISKCIDAMNESGAPILALDLPSGLNADTGTCVGACIQAQRTITFGVLKRGLQVGEGPQRAGQVSLAKISIPPHLIEEAFREQRSLQQDP